MKKDQFSVEKNYAIVLAAGLGTRMKSDLPKQYLSLSGKPVLAHTIEPFEKSKLIEKVVVTVNSSMMSYCQENIIQKYSLKKVKLVEGGASRQESVLNALKTLNANKDDRVIIHDGARPLIRQMDIEKLIDQMNGFEALAPIIPINEDVVIEKDMTLKEILNRQGLYSLQTPMIFKYGKILDAHKRAAEDRFKTTEETQLILREKGTVKLFEGSPYYHKMVYPQDMKIICELRESMLDEETIISVEDAIEQFKLGKPVIISDSEDRENEGDLMIPSEIITPEIMNMLIGCGGIICFCVTKKLANRIGLKLMNQNKKIQVPSFTITIDAIEKFGVTTGTSAYDRVRTIQAALNDETTENDFDSPGHIFPLIAREGGLKVRQGHTEATVTLAKAAGYKSSSTICEVLNPDGSMARMPQLIEYAKKHGIKITTIDKIIRYAEKNNIQY